MEGKERTLMKIKSARGGITAALALLVALGAAACGNKGDANNNSNASRSTNGNTAATATATPTPASAAEDTALKNKVEANLTKYGVSGVTVDVKDGVVTLKGDVPAAKFMDARKAADEANPKRVMNQINKK
jgi:hyperosmotically inducible periplasmic protein